MKKIYPEYWQEASNELSKRDITLKSLIKEYSDTKLHSNQDPFVTLLKSIVGQQISVKAADSIWARLEDKLGSDLLFSDFLNPSEEALRGIGFSRMKIQYSINIANYLNSIFLASDLYKPEKKLARKCLGNLQRAILNKYFMSLNSKELRTELLAIKGVGEWTLEMFQIFYLMDANVFPVKDIGLINTIKKLYGINDLEEIKKLANKWEPYRTVATWYIWRSLDDEPVQY
ncbi:MAG: DNA-3-methyladenine glycosylase 2 family protein [Candidatus Caenarcaniphilales bacterium]|nr:DNA-3-methyladenine glycosylase 2 family protein [Candidatus Caenarcaniphilales bacterium]